MSQNRYENARKRVKELKLLYVHLVWYISVNVMLIFINMMTSSGSWWSIYPLMGWGLGIVAHCLYTLVLSRWGKEWEEKKIKEYLTKDNE
ncbi:MULTISPECIES: 2TM domain-containing protein [Peribacillus]|uniref:2TM domain-containing protein n=1 Tax=Peribacillus TaxID=2675229 RepID=UPI001F4DC31B|nr:MULTISPECIES: 2TM domain-containing protein [unclassified Peribacillus]MCK1985452.1 2TM domain-containing protein [Peribacillus sp. Aquil_B1]MCK2007814.1 2TM domain-containing protein [Peribacillus sp. Aquil_B8]